MTLPAFKLLRPRTIDEAVANMLEHSTHVSILAGGTDLLPSMKQKLFTPDYVMDIRGIDEMQGILVRAGMGVEIGALTPLSAIEDSESVSYTHLTLPTILRV